MRDLIYKHVRKVGKVRRRKRGGRRVRNTTERKMGKRRECSTGRKGRVGRRRGKGRDMMLPNLWKMRDGYWVWETMRGGGMGRAGRLMVVVTLVTVVTHQPLLQMLPLNLPLHPPLLQTPRTLIFLQ